MGLFATKARQAPAAGSGARSPRGLPGGCEAVGEALASGTGAVPASEVAGRSLAQDGVSLDEALCALRETARAVTGADPGFEEIRALSVAWSEAMLAHLHQLSCEDPLTGLASLAHLRSRLSELYRGQLGETAGPDRTHALVVLDLPEGTLGDELDPVDRAMRLARLGESARTVFTGTEPIGRSGPGRVVVIAERTAQLGRKVALVRTLAGTRGTARAWIEGLPPTDDGAGLLLDELCRS